MLMLVICGMVLGYVNVSNLWWFISKEIFIGFLNGVIWVVFIVFVIVLWK